MQAYLKSGIYTILTCLILLQFLFIPVEYQVIETLYKQPIILAGLSLLLLCIWASGEIVLPKQSFSWLLIAFVLLHLLSYFWAVHPSLIWLKSITWVGYFLLYAICVSLPKEVIESKYLQYVVLGIITVNLAQVYFQFIALLINNNWHFTIADIEKLPSFIRMNTNFLGSLLLFYIPVLLHLASDKSMKWLSYTNIGLIIILIPLFNSRGVTVGLTCLLGFLAIKYSRQQLKSVFIISISVLLSIGIMFYLFVDDKTQFISAYDPIKTLTQDTGDDRLEIWSNSIALFSEKPILGYGTGNWKTEVLKYGLNDYKNGAAYGHAHNMWIELSAELGLVGVFLLLSMVFVLLISCIKTQNYLGIAMLIVLLSTSFFYGIYNSFITVGSPYWILFFIWFGIHFRGGKKLPLGPNISFCLVVFSILCFAINTYQASSYTYFNQLRKTTVPDLPDFMSKYGKQQAIWLNGMTQNNNNLSLKARAQWRLKHRTEAIATMEEAMLLYPYSKANWYHLGNMYKSTGDYDNAITCYQNVLAMYNNHEPSYIQLANIGLLLADETILNYGTIYYHTTLNPYCMAYFSNEYLLHENSKVRTFWRKKCATLDKFEEILTDFNAKSVIKNR